MRSLYASAALLAFVAIGCTGTGVNDKQVYTPISGTTKLTATVAADQTPPTSVTFSVDGTPLAGQVTASGGTFSIDFDSTKFSTGIHYVKATGSDGVDILDNSIYISNAGGAAPVATATPPLGP